MRRKNIGAVFDCTLLLAGLAILVSLTACNNLLSDPGKRGSGSLTLSIPATASWIGVDNSARLQADGNGRAIAYANAIKIEINDSSGATVATLEKTITPVSEFKNITIQVPNVPVGDNYTISVKVYNSKVSSDKPVVIGTAKNIAIKKNSTTPIKISCTPFESTQLVLGETPVSLALVPGVEAWYWLDYEAERYLRVAFESASDLSFALFDARGVLLKKNTGTKLVYKDNLGGKHYLAVARMAGMEGQDETSFSYSLTAQNVVPCTITYHLDGGTNHAENPADYTEEDPLITLKTPTKTGYTFAGWYDNASFTGSAISSIPAGSTGDKTFYAKWTPNTAAITCTLDSANQQLVFSPATVTITLGGSQAISATGSWTGAATNWEWLVDNEAVAGATTSSFTFGSTWSNAPGVYDVSCTVKYNGLWYSGSVKITVTN